MTWRLVIASQRKEKQGAVINALSEGMTRHQVPHTIHIDEAPDDGPVVIIGQMWVVEKLLPKIIAQGRPYWLVDNGYYKASGKNQGATGHYEFTYRSLAPILMDDPDYTRFPAHAVLAPWRHKDDGYILIGHPGPSFGMVVGMDMMKWSSTIKGHVKKFTSRRILERDKWCQRPLDMDLRGAFCVVTHSSNIAVDAVLRGVPCVVAPTNPAAPVCRQDLRQLELPIYPDRSKWWSSLMSQQYTLAELSSGVAWGLMQRVMRQVDGA